MNKLSRDKRATILTLLCEGSSLRAISRITGVSLVLRSRINDSIRQLGLDGPK